jgi:hypothetical protein
VNRISIYIPTSTYLNKRSMKFISGAALALLFHASLCVPTRLSAASVQAVPHGHVAADPAVIWQLTKAEHVNGFPDTKPHKKECRP